jgi:hypothetical protein
MPEWAEKVITWDEVAQYIEEGTVESLGKLRRSEQQLTTYRAFMDQVGVGMLTSCLQPGNNADTVSYAFGSCDGAGEGGLCQRGRFCQDHSAGTNQQSERR